MELSNNQLYFIGSNCSKDDISKYITAENYQSIYRVCGVSPWMFVCKFESLNDAIYTTRCHQLNIKSVVAAKELFSNEEVVSKESKLNILFWIYIKGNLEDSDFVSSIIEPKKNSSKYIISNAYKTFGEYNFLVKLYTSNINGPDEFLDVIQKRRMSSTRKCVLSTVKENGVVIAFDSEGKSDKSKEIKRDVEYSITRIMANIGEVVQKRNDYQKRFFEDKLKRMGVPVGDVGDYILDPKLDGTEYNRDELRHPINLIDRYSIKLNRGKWLKVLLFFKSHPEPYKKGKLRDALYNNLLRVGTTQFSRKLYHIAGDYDFIVPFDCTDLETLNKEIDAFCEDHGELITSFTNTICRPTEGRGSGSLDPLDVHFLESLLINATQINEFEKRIKGENILSSLVKDDELMLAEEGVTPREDYVRNKLKTLNIRSKLISNYIRSFNTFEDVGVETTIEYHDGALIQVLSKFYFNKTSQKIIFLQTMKDKLSSFDIIANIYEPVRDPLTVMCIIMVKELVELEVIYDDLQKHCRKIEFHIIFHQNYYSKVIEKNIRCKPCFYPIIPIRDKCRDNCNSCTEYRKCIRQNCGNCIRYILPRQRHRILNLDFGKKEFKRDVNITLIGVDLKLFEYFALEKSLDQEGIRDKIFENYSNKILTKNLKHYLKKVSLEKKHNSVTFFYEPIEKIKSGYNNIINTVGRETYRENYKRSIMQALNLALNTSKQPDIIIFPEYSIPISVYNEIKAFKIDKNCIIVAGSYVEDRFNVCPIIFNYISGKKHIYHYYKNNYSPFEKDLDSDLFLLKNRGTAYLKFLNTHFGNFYVQLCYDAFILNVNLR